MRMAAECATDSPDAQTKVGAVLLSERGRQIASGFNGFLRGAHDHLLPKSRPGKYVYMQHAERNLLYNCLDESISTRNTTVICTLSPCAECLRACYQAGVTCIIFDKLYFQSTDFYTRLPDVYVRITKLSNGFTKLDLEPGSNHSEDFVRAILEEEAENRKRLDEWEAEFNEYMKAKYPQ